MKALLELGPEALGVLEEIMGILGCDMGEAIERALGTEIYLLKHVEAGNRVIVRTGRGDREVNLV